jgi:hypothetical protein
MRKIKKKIFFFGRDDVWQVCTTPKLIVLGCVLVVAFKIDDCIQERREIQLKKVNI